MAELLRITQPGIYDLTAEQYHADPCPQPSFSRSIGKLLLDASPAHARLAHPRLSGLALARPPAEDEEDATAEPAAAGDVSKDRDIGTIAHAMFLRGEDVAEVIEFDNYKSKAAKQARDAALAAGRVPVKRKEYDRILRMVDALESFRARTGAFTEGQPERTVIWRENSIWCRCMIDWLPDEPSAPIWDLKTTAGFATSSAWTRAAFQHGADLQAVLYPRGCAEVRDGVVPDGMNFCVIENTMPHGIRVFQFSPEALGGAEGEIGEAMDLYGRCMRDDAWPIYPAFPEVVEAPGYIQRDRDWRHRQRTGLPIGYATKSDAAVGRMIASGNMGG